MLAIHWMATRPGEYKGRVRRPQVAEEHAEEFEPINIFHVVEMYEYLLIMIYVSPSFAAFPANPHSMRQWRCADRGPAGSSTRRRGRTC